ncbi:hypothetical protein DFH08DRAFT_1013759 [Mycena albidolilacea]|uniref:Peptidase A1 domain-containing protein n=1 Tax=Mycena albidolilacea TaxID=1033008 RepID=A0AAD7ENQ7_9AGAR|nr:hypothetical protein DFH08DRAFT_1013759 [Mycena albidolilacea]
MSGVFVIVDDQDPNIRYSTGWGPGPDALMLSPTALLHLTFDGTSISVFGLIGRNSNKPNTTFDFSIDGVFQNSTIIPSDENEHFHRRFFASQALEDGRHTLEIAISQISSTNVLLDYLIYEASQNATLDPLSSAQLLVLNTNPQLAYSQGWSTGISGLRSGLFETAISLNNSVEGAVDLGATVALNFTGSGFEVRGVLVKEFPRPVAAYSLDGGPWVDVQMPTIGSSYTNAQSNFEFIGQTFNSMETHSLVITPLIAGAFFLDFITVQSPTAFFPRKANVAPPPSLSSSIAISPTFTQPLSPAASGSGVPTVHGMGAGAIAGICITIVACLCVAALAVFLLRRRRRRKVSPDQPSGSRSVSEVAASTGTTAWTRFDLPSRSVTPFTVYRDDEPSGATVTGKSQPPMVRMNQRQPRKGQQRMEPVVRVEESEDAMTEPPAYSDRPDSNV